MRLASLRTAAVALVLMLTAACSTLATLPDGYLRFGVAPTDVATYVVYDTTDVTDYDLEVRVYLETPDEGEARDSAAYWNARHAQDGWLPPRQGR